MLRPKKQTEDLLLSKTKNCETLIEQTHRKAEYTLESRMTKPREQIHFNTSLQIKGDWMIGLTDLEVSNSIFDINTTNNKLKRYKFLDEKAGVVSYEKVRDDIEKYLDVSNNTATGLQDEKTTPIVIEEYREQVTKRMKDDKYMLTLSMYVDSIFQDFESFLRTEIDWVQEDFRLVLY